MSAEEEGLTKLLSEKPVPTDAVPFVDAGALFERHRARIHRYVRGMVRNHAEAEDLTQETFLRAHRQLGSLRDPAAVSTWLYRIATHVCYDRFRQTSRGRPVDPAGDEPIEEAAPRLDKLFEQAEMSACIQKFIGTLPDAQRQVLLLHDVHGLTGPEIARLSGSSLDAVKIRLHRARRGLQAALAGGCDFSRDERDVLVCSPKSPPGATPQGAQVCSRSSRER